MNPVSLLEPFDVMGPRLLFTGIGGTVMTALIWARHHFLWWPIHYIGFAVSATNMTSASWFSIFLGSVLKAFILKYGGVRLYRAPATPLSRFHTGADYLLCVLARRRLAGRWHW